MEKNYIIPIAKEKINGLYNLWFNNGFDNEDNVDVDKILLRGSETDINNFGSFVHAPNVDINVSIALYLLDFISLSLFLNGDMIFLPFRLITISDFSTKDLFNLKLSGSQN